MKKHVLLLFVLVSSIQLFAKIDLPDHKLGRDRFVTNFTSVLTPTQEDQLKQRLSDYEKQTSVEIAVVLINSLSDYGYDNDIFDFTSELFQKWKVGKKIADNGVVYVIAVKDHKARLGTGYGVGEGMTDLQCKDLLLASIPYMKQNDYFGAINFVLDGVAKGLAKTDAVDKNTIVAKTQAKAEQEQKDSVAVVGDWFLFVIIPILLVVFLILYFVIKYQRKKAAKLAAAAKAKADYQQYQSSIADVRKELKDIKDYIAANATLAAFDPDSINAANDFVRQLEEAKFMNVQEWEFANPHQAEQYTKDANAMIDKVNKATAKIQVAKNKYKTTTDNKNLALAYAKSVNEVISQNITSKVNQYNAALAYLHQYPAYLALFNTDAAAKEIAGFNASEYQAQATALSNEANTITFAFGAYDNLLKRIDAHRASIVGYFKSGIQDALMRKQQDVVEAVAGLKRYDDASVESLKAEARSASNQSDVSYQNKTRAAQVQTHKPKHTNDILADWVYLQHIVQNIKAATRACNDDVAAAEAERRRIIREREEAEERERQRLAAIAAAALAAEEAERRRRDDDNNSRSGGFGGFGDSNNNNNDTFGGGSTGGGGADVSW